MTDTSQPEAPEAEATVDESSVIQDLRKRAAKADEAEARAAAAERNLAFTEAGIPKDGMGSYFRDAYKGDLDPDAIRAEATAAGFTPGTAAAPTTPDPALAAEATDASAVSAAMAGGGTPAPSGNLAERAREIGKDGYGDVNALDAFIGEVGPGEAELKSIFGV